MQLIDAGTTKELFKSADEIIEHMRFISYTAAYEVVETRHDDLTQWLLVAYSVELGDALHDHWFTGDKLISAEVFKSEYLARLRLVSNISAL